jgi:hypothetical protein
VEGVAGIAGGCRTQDRGLRTPVLSGPARTPCGHPCPSGEQARRPYRSADLNGESPSGPWRDGARWGGI